MTDQAWPYQTPVLAINFIWRWGCAVVSLLFDLLSGWTIVKTITAEITAQVTTPPQTLQWPFQHFIY